MTMTLDAWTSDVNGRSIGDGQCVALVQDYLTRVMGGGFLSTDGSSHSPYAIGAWEGYTTNGLSQFFTQADASQTMLPGWCPVWKYGFTVAPFTPFSHIAVGLKDMGAGVQCMTQNPGPAHYMIIPKVGLAGYLVPKNGGSPMTANLASDTTSNPVSSTFDLIAAVNKISAYVGNSGNWKRIGVMALGIVLLLTVLIIMFGEQTADALKEIPQ